jgi:hypothetical protein
VTSIDAFLVDLSGWALGAVVLVPLLVLARQPASQQAGAAVPLAGGRAPGLTPGGVTAAGQDGSGGADAAAGPGEGESLADFRERLKRTAAPKKSGITADMLDTANSYDDKVALVRMLVTEDSGRVAAVLKAMMQRDAGR